MQICSTLGISSLKSAIGYFLYICTEIRPYFFHARSGDKMMSLVFANADSAVFVGLAM